MRLELTLLNLQHTHPSSSTHANFYNNRKKTRTSSTLIGGTAGASTPVLQKMHQKVHPLQLHHDHPQLTTRACSSHCSRRASHVSRRPTKLLPRGKSCLRKCGSHFTAGMEAALLFRSVDRTTKYRTSPTTKIRVWQRQQPCQGSALAVPSVSVMSASSAADQRRVAGVRLLLIVATNAR